MAQTADIRINGVRFMAGTVTLDGSNPTPVDLTGLVSSILAGGASFAGTAAPAADPNNLSVNINGVSLDIYAWKITAVGDATEVASTNAARVINWWAWGVDVTRKGS